jgi:hypothetical protein
MFLEAAEYLLLRERGWIHPSFAYLGLDIAVLEIKAWSLYRGREITASFVDRYKQTRGMEGKTARR